MSRYGIHNMDWSGLILILSKVADECGGGEEEEKKDERGKEGVLTKGKGN